MAERKKVSFNAKKKKATVKTESEIMQSFSSETTALPLLPLNGTLEEKINWTVDSINVSNKLVGEIKGHIEEMAKVDPQYRKWICTTSSKALKDTYALPERTLSRYTSELKHDWQNEIKQEVLSLQEGGRSERQIAQELELSKNKVHRILEESVLEIGDEKTLEVEGELIDPVLVDRKVKLRKQTKEQLIDRVVALEDKLLK